MNKAVFSLLVENSSGVLSRISGLFSRREYNIDSLTVGETLNPKLSRMTVTASGDEEVLEQIQKQLEKLIDVKKIVRLPDKESVCRELILVKILCKEKDRAEIISLANIFRARIIDVAAESLVIELTGEQSKLSAFMSLIDTYEIKAIARTGITGLSRGLEDM